MDTIPCLVVRKSQSRAAPEDKKGSYTPVVAKTVVSAHLFVIY